MKGLLLMLVVAKGVCAQTLLLEGEIRPRTEFRLGYGQPLPIVHDPGVFTMQRTRLNLSFESEFCNVKVVLQDARIFGQEPHNSDMATVGVNEAWAEVELLDSVRLRLGRQGICFDDNRLFSSPAWSNTGSSHDMALLHYNHNNWQLQLATAFNNNRAISAEQLYKPGADYRWMGILHVSKRLRNDMLLSAIVVDEGLQDTLGVGVNYKRLKMNHCYTFGGNLKFEPSNLPFSTIATAYWQRGKSADGKIMKGQLLAAKLSYKFSGNLQASVGADYLSGDANGGADGTASNFKKLYGADHTFNGYMDYWNTSLNSGLVDLYAKLTTRLGKKVTLECAYHTFRSEFDAQNKYGIAYAKNIGAELDIVLNYKHNKSTTFQGGFCRYFANKNTIIAKGLMNSNNIVPEIHAPQWAYVMITIKTGVLKLNNKQTGL